MPTCIINICAGFIFLYGTRLTMMLDDLILRALMHIIEQNDQILNAGKVYHTSSEPLLEEIRTWMRDTHYSAQR